MQVKDLIKIPGIKPEEICSKYISKQSLALIAQLQISANKVLQNSSQTHPQPYPSLTIKTVVVHRDPTFFYQLNQVL